MKTGSTVGFRGKHFLVTLFALLCSSIFLWAWEKTPLAATLVSQEEQFRIFSPGAPANSESFSEKLEKYDASLDVDRNMETGKWQNGQKEPLRQENEVKGISPFAVEIKERKNNLSEGIPTKEGKITSEDNIFGVTEKTTLQPNHSLGSSALPVLRSSSESREKHEPLVTSSVEEKGCNYAKGRWIPDRKHPLYSGFSCKPWLSEMWACRLTQRSDFSYEGYKWKPQGCDIPEFDALALLKRLQGKTVAFVGDSLGRQQFQSLMCMLTGGKEMVSVHDFGSEYGLVKAKGAIRPDGWVYRFMETNTTILYYWSATLCELDPINATDRHTGYAMHLDRPAFFLRKYLPKFDVLVLNTGHHWNRGKLQANRWIMHVDGRPNDNRALAEMGHAKNFTIHSIIKWMDSQLPKHAKLKAFFRTISPRHFVNGDWNTGGSCSNTIPLRSGSEVLQESSADPVAESAVRGTRIKLLDITALSQLRDECHIAMYNTKGATGIQDCLHWCLPGVPDTWNEILLAQI